MRLGDLAVAPVRAMAAVARLTTSMVFARSRSGFALLARTVFDYRTEIGDPMTNSIVGAVVGWMARNFPEAPVAIVHQSDPRERIPMGPSGPGAMLALLERPNRYYSGVVQWMATLVDFIRGDAYWIKVRSAGRQVVELWWVPAKLMEPKWPENDSRVFISHYEYKVGDEAIEIAVEDVVHFRNGINPQNPRKGQDRLLPLFREVFTDNEAANFTASMLRNLGVPGVVISPANTQNRLRGDPEEIKERFIERTSGDRRGEPMVFTAPTDVKVLSFSPQQMDLKGLRRIPEERVSAQLGIPAGVAQLGAGLDRNTFSNYGEANRAAISQGLVPLARLMAAELEVQLLPDFTSDLGLEVFFDFAATAAMAEAMDAVWKRNESAATKGLITRADFRRAVGLPVSAEDEVYIMPNNFIQVDVGKALPALPVRSVAAASAGPVVYAEESRCPVCAKLLGYDLSGQAWCNRCRAPRVFPAREAASA